MNSNLSNPVRIPDAGRAIVLSCRSISKSFGGVPVLRGVSLDLPAGTVTALAGENGAGKSTLLKIASGQYRQDSGDVLVRGEPITPGNVADARRLGIAIVPQELASIDDLTVYENLMVGREIRRARFLDRGAMIHAAGEALGEFGVPIDPKTRMGDLPVGLRQIVEIVKATRGGAQVLLLDEPTSALSRREIDRLYAVVKKLRDQDVAVALTTHKMDEMRALADQVVVLRDGNLALDQSMSKTRDDQIVTAMIGRELDALFPDVAEPSRDICLEIAGVRVEQGSDPIDLTVRRGEIVGLAGLVGAGRTELIEAVFGIRPRNGGEVRVNGNVVGGHVRDAINAGMALVPEDRKAGGAVLSMSVLDNGTVPRTKQFSKGGFLKGKVRRNSIEVAMNSVRLRARGLNQEVGTLSGGNQQKVVVARWLTAKVDILLLDEPTRGVDVGARSEIYRIISDLAASGMAVLMASSDMPEILGLAHRALVLREGTVAGELSRANLLAPDGQAQIFHLAAGLDGESGDVTNDTVGVGQ